jgi:hypothetical protein
MYSGGDALEAISGMAVCHAFNVSAAVTTASNQVDSRIWYRVTMLVAKLDRVAETAVTRSRF